MAAVANVLKNRTNSGEFKSKGNEAKQALAPYQFSLWNPYTVQKKPFNDVEKNFGDKGKRYMIYTKNKIRTLHINENEILLNKYNCLFF